MKQPTILCETQHKQTETRNNKYEYDNKDKNKRYITGPVAWC